MKIKKLIFKNTTEYKYFVPDIGFGYVLEIETEDPSYEGEKEISLRNINGNNNFSFEILKIIETIFLPQINLDTKLEIGEILFQINSNESNFSYINDFWNGIMFFEEEKNYRKKLSEWIHIGEMRISLPTSTKNLSLNHIGFVCDVVYINAFGEGSIGSININGPASININTSIQIGEISIGQPQNAQEIFLSNLRCENINILNLGYPTSNKKIKNLEMMSCKINNLQFRGFEEAYFIIENCRLYGSQIYGGIIENVNFKALSIQDTRLSDISFSSLVFPRNKIDFLIKNTRFERNTYSNVDWGKYFNEYELSKYKKDGKDYEKRWYISSAGLKEIYRMLKYEHDVIGNKTEANKFYQKEMEYYKKSLIENYTCKTFFNLDIGQKRLVCWYNQITNNFGNSWLRPILLMVVLVLIATIYEYGASQGDFDWGTVALSKVLPIQEIGKFTSWWTLLYQLSWSALIYQFLVALRRISQR